MLCRGAAPIGKVRAAGTKNIKIPHTDDRAQNGGEQLAQNGSPRSTRDAHIERQDKDKVEHNIEKCREYQEKQRGAAVAEAAEHVGDHVIKHRRPGAEEDNEHIAVGLGINILRRAHPPKYRVGERAEEDGYDNGKARRQQPRYRRARSLAGNVARSEALGKADAEAAGEALHEAEDKIDNDRRGADGGESLRAERAPDDNGIGQSIEKLKEIAGNDREGELQQHPERFALCEIL